MRRRVDLPEPAGPVNAKASPAANEKESGLERGRRFFSATQAMSRTSNRHGPIAIPPASDPNGSTCASGGFAREMRGDFPFGEYLVPKIEVVDPAQPRPTTR